MTELATLAVQRAQLPAFPGATLPDQLAAGRAAAEAILQKYVPGFSYDQSKADATLAKIGVWEERNQKDLEAVLANPNAEKLPQAICLAFGSDMAQQFILAGFTRAAIGIGPWQSGSVAAAALEGKLIQPRWAQEDAAYRLQVFGSIVKMEQDGYLKHLFVPPADAASKDVQCGVSGFGAFGLAPVVVWAVAFVVVAVVAVLLLYFYSSVRLKENNRLMVDLCKDAEAKGDAATVQKCIEASANLQKEPMIPGLSELGKGLAQAALVIGLVYVGFKVIPPMLAGRKARTT